MKTAEAARAVQAGATLARAEARELFAGVLAGASGEAETGELLLALARRGERAPEIAGAAEALRAAMRPFEHAHADAIDTAGTGGDGLGLFNLSTAAALVAAAAGARVVKHGNRAASSRCGSADLLEAAGVAIDPGPARSRALLDELGICFLYAPSYHPALARLAPLRRALRTRTVFNLLGPLCNPGRVTRQLLGVADETLLEAMAAALGEIDGVSAYVVHGAGGADELTLCGPNRIVAIRAPAAEGLEPATGGLAPAPLAALCGGDARENVQHLRAVLRAEPGARTDAVLLNAAAALMVAGIRPAGAAFERARTALESGAAARLLERWARLSRGKAA